MDLPRSSSDTALATACPVCLGNGGFGPRITIREKLQSSCFKPCTTCHGSGWQHTRLPDLSPKQAETLRTKLTTIPADPDAQYLRQSTKDNIVSHLSQRWIEAVTFPGLEPACIDLVNKRGTILRILPEFRGGKFHNLNVIPQTHRHQFPLEPETTP